VRFSDGGTAVFDRGFLDDLEYWGPTDRKRALRTLKLIEAVLRDPRAGIGKPESLRGELAGCWSRRIDHVNRLVYEIVNGQVLFLAARHHY